MNRDEIFAKINTIAQDVFEEESIVIKDETTANDVDGWDSLTHLIFINEIESEYGVKFTLGEIQGSKNVGELVDSLIRHIEGK